MPDICLNRHQGSPTSWAAFQQACADMPRQRAEVLRLITQAGERGLTGKECAALMNVPHHRISGRISELKTQNKIRHTRERREGSAVLFPTN